jgi:hypothetical protein
MSNNQGLQNQQNWSGFHGFSQNRSGLVLKTDRIFIKTKTSTVANIFGCFLRFIDWFLSILKTGTVPIFESMATTQPNNKNASQTKAIIRQI